MRNIIFFIIFIILTVVSGVLLGAAMWFIEEKLAITLLTIYLWSVIYGSVLYQNKFVMKLFKK